MESLGDLDQLEVTAAATDESVPSQIDDRIRAAEIRLAMAASEIGNRALSLFIFEQSSSQEKIIKYAGELLLTSSRVLKKQGEVSSLTQLDEQFDMGESQTAKKILAQIPFPMYEVLSALDEGASRAQAAEKFGLTEEYVWENMRKLYEMLEVNKPGDALKAIIALFELRGFDQDQLSSDLEPEYPPAENARESLHEELAELSDTELDILGCVSLGLNNKQIATARFITVGTVKFHLTSIYRKLGVVNRTLALNVGNHAGIVEWALTIGEDDPNLMFATKKQKLQMIEQERISNR